MIVNALSAFLAVAWVYLQFVVVAFSDHTQELCFDQVSKIHLTSVDINSAFCGGF